MLFLPAKAVARHCLLAAWFLKLSPPFFSNALKFLKSISSGRIILYYYIISNKSEKFPNKSKLHFNLPRLFFSIYFYVYVQAGTKAALILYIKTPTNTHFPLLLLREMAAGTHNFD